MAGLNLNERSRGVVLELKARAAELGAAVHTIGGADVIDAGSKQPGSLGAGVLLARACLADLATVSLVPSQIKSIPLPAVAVAIDQPVAACMASQYAGWQISVGDYYAMGSGPMRAAYAKEELYKDHALTPHVEKPTCAVGILEASKLPSEAVIAYLAERTGVAAANITLLLARTASLAGGVQVVARSVETALHKLHALKFDLARIVAGFGTAPLPPVAKGDLAAIGRTNDAVLYGAQVTLYTTGDDDSLRDAARKLPSSSSADYGRPFGEIFKQYNHDFYKIDPMLFSPAQVCVQNITTGNSFHFGSVNDDVLLKSFYG